MTQVTSQTPKLRPRTSPPAPAASAQPQANRFLIGPLFDLIFIANLYWPALLMLDLFGGEPVHNGLLFWQVYFVTAPHRWITLMLVCCDRQKTRGREWAFLSFGALIVVGCLALNFSTSSLLCLGAIDYIWNAWHFASQHHGIHRIYERRNSTSVSAKSGMLHKLAFRGFLLYVIARVAGVGWSTSTLTAGWSLATVDFVIVLIPLWLIGETLVRSRNREADRRLPGGIYLVSVMTMFLAMLFAAHTEKRQLVLQLALASAVFHSIEYMAIVSWSSATAKNRERRDLMGRMARTWITFLVLFVVILGVGNYFIARENEKLWILMNLIVAFLHYSYDGMIWKAKRPAVARQPSG